MLWTNTVAMTTDLPNPDYFILHPFSFQGSYALSISEVDQDPLPPVNSTIPEPETYGMLITGLGLIGFMARRRKQNARIY